MSIAERLNEEADYLEDARNGGDGKGRARRGGVKDTGLCAQAFVHRPLCVFRMGMLSMVVTAREEPAEVVSKAPASVLRPLLTSHCA
jgi:hypothetical protein